MEEIIFKVTKEIIKESVARIKKGALISQNCPVVLALHTRFPYASAGEYQYNENKDNVYGNGMVGKLPYEASDFINDFDHADNTERLLLPELEFTLQIPN